VAALALCAKISETQDRSHQAIAFEDAFQFQHEQDTLQLLNIIPYFLLFPNRSKHFDLLSNVLKLSIAIRMLLPFLGLAIALQTITQFSHQGLIPSVSLG
jgi:hypothetical protein